MQNEANEEVSYDFDENAPIEDDEGDEGDSILNGENNIIKEKRKILLDKNSFKSKTKKIKFTNFCFKKIIMLSSIPTIIYNIFWIIMLYKIKVDESDNINLINYKFKISWTCFFVLLKDILILLFPLVYHGSGRNINDFSHFRVGIKTLLNLILSYCITKDMTNNLDLDPNFKIFEAKNDVNYLINLFYNLELIYIYGIIYIILLSIIIILVVVSIEFWTGYYRYAIE